MKKRWGRGKRPVRENMRGRGREGERERKEERDRECVIETVLTI